MKKIIVIISLIATNVTAQTVYPTGATGCIARYTFDLSDSVASLNPLIDASGNSNNGASTNLTSTNGWKNISNTAGGFDGTSSFSEVAHKAMLNPSTITMVAVVKPTGWYNGTCQCNTIVHKGYDHGVVGNSWTMYYHDNDVSCSSFSATTQNLGYGVATIQSTSTNNTNYISLNNWYFMAVTFDGSQTNFYQTIMDANNYNNNLQARTLTPTSGLGNSNYNFLIGASINPNFKYWFNGSMDEVVIFNRALTQTEIQGVYDYLWGVAPLGIQNNIPSNRLHQFCLDRTIRSSSNDMHIKNLVVTDVNGSVLVNKKNISTLNENLNGYASQMVFVKVLLENGETIVEKLLIQ
jgi:hypothetical protein